MYLVSTSLKLNAESRACIYGLGVDNRRVIAPLNDEQELFRYGTLALVSEMKQL
jgi:hypothetical protein